MGGMTIVDGYLFQTNGDGGVSVFCDGKRIAEIPSMTLDEVFALDDEDIDDLVFANAVREKNDFSLWSIQHVPVVTLQGNSAKRNL